MQFISRFIFFYENRLNGLICIDGKSWEAHKPSRVACSTIDLYYSVLIWFPVHCKYCRHVTWKFGFFLLSAIRILTKTQCRKLFPLQM
jgi:hypothetical protein